MNTLAFIGNLAGPDLIIILLIILVLFGAKRLPELARGMGQAMKEFQKAKEDFTDEMHRSGAAPDEVKVRPAATTVARIENPPPAVEAAPPAAPARASVSPNDPRDLV